MENKAPQDKVSPKKTPVRKISTADKIKFCGLLLFMIIFIAIGVLLLPYFEHMTTEDGRQMLAESIQNAGVIGIGICLLLQFIQIVVAFIPGEFTQLAIGAVYGPFLGTVVILLGAFIASAFLFFLVRKLGAPFVQSMIGDKDSKLLDFINKGRRLPALVFILFLIPGLPKDVFTYLFPLTKIRPAQFLLISTLGRTPAVAASAYVGSAALKGDYTQAIIVGIIAGGLGLLGIIFNKQIMSFIDFVEEFLKDRLAKRKSK